jgi:serine/threonine protein kinase
VASASPPVSIQHGSIWTAVIKGVSVKGSSNAHESEQRTSDRNEPSRFSADDPTCDVWLAKAPRDSSGRPILGGISLLSRLGSSTLGVIYLGYHQRLETKVIVRVFPSDWEFIGSTNFKEILADARVLAKLKSPYLVTVLDAGEALGLTYVIQEYMEGGVSAKDYLNHVAQGMWLPESDALAITLGATRGMADAHAVGVIHCDINPLNILIPYQADSKRYNFLGAKLVDFGKAVGLRPNDDKKWRETGYPGAISYTAP